MPKKIVIDQKLGSIILFSALLFSNYRSLTKIARVGLKQCLLTKIFVVLAWQLQIR